MTKRLLAWGILGLGLIGVGSYAIYGCWLPSVMAVRQPARPLLPLAGNGAPGNIVVLEDRPNRPRLPADSQPFQFNGATVWIVPLG